MGDIFQISHPLFYSVTNSNVISFLSFLIGVRVVKIVPKNRISQFLFKY